MPMEKILCKLRRFFNGAYQLAVLDMAAGKRWRVKPLSSNLPYLKGENARNNHILIQPLEQALYLMADDITPELLQKHHKLPNGTWKPGRMVVETSPENFQVWIRAHRPIPLEEKRYWLKKMKSDPGADPCNRWGRCPGFRNRKNKYRNSKGFYPLARLIWADWKHTAHIPSPAFIKTSYKPEHFSHLPLEGGVCRLPVFPRSHYDRGDESATDFAFSMALFRRGLDENEVRRQILEQRTTWKNHSSPKQNDAYLRRTISKAKMFVKTS